jgi:hypothetical protein
MKKFLGPVVLAAGLFMVSSIAEAACVTTRNGIRSTTVCNGVVTKRYGNRSVTYGRGGVVTRRQGTRSATYGRGYTTYRQGRRSVTYGTRPWYY